jgi:WD40 repeat protein
MTDLQVKPPFENGPENRGSEDFLPKISQAGIAQNVPTSVGGGNYPNRIGSYQIISVLGRGGMGLVYLAQQQQPKRIVALKVIHPGLASLGHLRRILREAEVLGRLQHPGIAQIYEAGTADSAEGSEPFIAMEYIRGTPITDYVLEKSLPIPSRLELFGKVCDAIEYAHRQGIVHRDIKPGNIMVDQTGQPKVLDFGVARMLDSDHRIGRQTEDGQFIGTLAYMSPEHASAKSDEIDIRSDIYALGVVLYQMLSGKMPYTVDGCSVIDAVRVIQEDDPTRLSTLSKRYGGDIDVIVNKALEKNKTNRYQSAADLAADIRRHLNDQPILARAPSRRYQLRKFVRRHKALFLSMTAVFVALVAGLIGTTWQAVRATQQEVIAQKNAALANIESKEAQLRLAEGMISQGGALLMANRASDARVSYTQAWDIFDKVGVSGLPAQLGVWDIDRQHRPPLRSFPGDSSTGLSIFVGNDLIASAKGADIVLRDAPTGHLLRVLGGQTGSVVALFSVSDGQRVVSASSDGVLRVWDSANGSCIYSIRLPDDQMTRVAIAPAGTQVATIGKDYRVRLWNLETGAPVRDAIPRQGYSREIALAGDGGTIVEANGNCKVTIANTNKQLPPQSLVDYYTGTIRIAASSDGRLVASSDSAGTVDVFDCQSRRRLCAIKVQGYAACLDFSPDGRGLAIGCSGGAVMVCDVNTGQKVVELAGLQASIANLSFSNDGQLLLATDGTGMATIWCLAPDIYACRLTGSEGTVRKIAVARNVPAAVSSGINGTLRVWDAATGKTLNVLDGHSGRQACVAMSSDGQLVASAGDDSTLRLWDVGAGKPRRVLHVSTSSAPISLIFSADDRTIFAATGDGNVIRWEAGGDGSSMELASGLIGPDELVPLPDGKDIYCAQDDGIACFKQHTKMTPPIKFGAGSGGVLSLQLSPDGHTLASGRSDGGIRFWDVKSGGMIRSIASHSGPVAALAFLNDEAVASIGDDRTVSVWRLLDGTEIRRLYHADAEILGIKVVADPLTLLFCTNAGFVQSLNLSCPRYEHLHFLSFDRQCSLLEKNADDGPALAEFGGWCAAHGATHWATSLFERAGQHQGAVSPLTLARCYWKLGQFNQAQQAFERALQQSEAPEDYLRLCLEAVKREHSGNFDQF